jgi:fimbrial chaperone protein
MQLKTLRKRIDSCALAALCVISSTMLSWCGTLTVSPVRIQVSTSRPNATLQIVNREDEPVTVQLHIVTWSFNGQNDVLADSDEVMLNPPIAVVAGRHAQAIRLGLRKPNDSLQERCYRLIIEEVPPAPKPNFVGIRTIVKLSIPIFVSPKTAISPRLSWQAVRTSDSRVTLIATNQGSAHIQIRAMDVTGTDPAQPYLKGVPPTYILPNQQREWVIEDQRALVESRMKVTGVTDAGALHETIEIVR